MAMWSSVSVAQREKRLLSEAIRGRSQDEDNEEAA